MATDDNGCTKSQGICSNGISLVFMEFGMILILVFIIWYQVGIICIIAEKSEEEKKEKRKEIRKDRKDDFKDVSYQSVLGILISCKQ